MGFLAISDVTSFVSRLFVSAKPESSTATQALPFPYRKYDQPLMFGFRQVQLPRQLSSTLPTTFALVWQKWARSTLFPPEETCGSLRSALPSSPVLPTSKKKHNLSSNISCDCSIERFQFVADVSFALLVATTPSTCFAPSQVQDGCPPSSLIRSFTKYASVTSTSWQWRHEALYMSGRHY